MLDHHKAQVGAFTAAWQHTDLERALQAKVDRQAAEIERLSGIAKIRKARIVALRKGLRGYLKMARFDFDGGALARRILEDDE